MLRHRALTLISLISLVAACGLLATGCGDSKKTKSKGGTPAGQTPADAVKSSIKKLADIKSGRFKFEATLSGTGMPGAMKFAGDGAFDTKAKGGPAVELNASFNMGSQAQKIGFVALEGKAYMIFGDQAFSMDDTLKGATGATGGADNPGQISEKDIQEMIDLLDGLIGEVQEAGTADVGGATVTVYTAKLDVKKAAAEAEKKAGESLSGIPGLSDLNSLTSMFGDTTVRIGVDGDQMPRLVEIETSMATPTATTGGTEGGAIKFRLELIDPNEPVTIKKPENVTDSEGALDMLGGMFGGGLGATE